MPTEKERRMYDLNADGVLNTGDVDLEMIIASV